MASDRRIYLPNLDSLRFIFFLLIFIHNFLLLLFEQSIPINYFLLFIKKYGWIGVDGFFIISGFIITLLLLTERKRYGFYSLKNFYVRRLLRIVPLYFLVLLIGIVLNILTIPRPNDQVLFHLPFFITFTSNIPAIFPDAYIPYLAHLWAVSFELQFYIIWPLVLLKIKNLKQATFVCGGMIVLGIIFRAISYNLFLDQFRFYTNPLLRFDVFMYGCLLGFFYATKPDKVKKLIGFFNIQVTLLATVLFVSTLFIYFINSPKSILTGVFGYNLVDLFICCLLLNVLNPRSVTRKFFSFKLFVYLGKISYGLYLWHFLAITLIITFFDGGQDVTFTIFLISLFSTILLSFLTYRFFESAFLKIKLKLTKVPNRQI